MLSRQTQFLRNPDIVAIALADDAIVDKFRPKNKSRSSKMTRERPPRSLRSRLPLTRGRAAAGGRGSLSRHLELAPAELTIHFSYEIQDNDFGRNSETHGQDAGADSPRYI